MIGREKEIDILSGYKDSDEAEFIVIYGRRRVGKTFLIKEFFDDRFFFYFTGIAESDMHDHLERFAKSLKDYGVGKEVHPTSWMEAFDLLEDMIKETPSIPNEKKVIFFDEMPWMDTPKSKFISALEYFWNSFASRRKDVLFIVCGSATSWMVNKLFKNRGGLHNRITGKIHLLPFTLAECETYMKSRNIVMGRYDIVEFYMIFGGIPYYLRYLKEKYSLSQNVDRILFYEDAPLRDEYETLYKSLFRNPERYEEVITALAKKSKGLTREEIVESVSISDGGTLSKVLVDLELSGFIRKYYAFPNKSKGAIFQLIDNFTLFHQSFMEGNKKTDEHYWTAIRDTPKLNNWRGYAFEQVCLQHLNKIRKSLEIGGILVGISAWKSKTSTIGAQIDLVINRADNIINLCEIKYSKYEFEITKSYEDNLRNKVAAFEKETGTKRGVHITLISTYGLKKNMYSGIINSEVTMDDLFS
jgi:AAA+ ATPase superfamily predicted ATPase